MARPTIKSREQYGDGQGEDVPALMAALKERTSLAEYAESHLERKGKTYVCPVCNSGNGPKGTPAFAIDGESWRCFSCNGHGDVFDLCGAIEGTDDRKTQLESVARWAGVDFTTLQATPTTPKPPKPAPDYSGGRERERAYMEQCRARIGEPEAVEYLSSRGVSEEQARAWGFGFDKSRHRIVMPWKGCEWYHVDRATRAGVHKYDKPKSRDVGPQPVYNPDAVGEPVFFVVESVLNALAVETMGYEAIACGGTAWEGPCEHITANGKGCAVLAFDPDDAGRKAAREMGEALAAAGYPYVLASYSDDYGERDLFDLWATDSGEFAELVEAAAATAEDASHARKLAEFAESSKALRVHEPAELARRIREGSELETPTPTGFRSLDMVLGGGLKRGLYVLGAGSSVGKTSLLVQLACTMAANGSPVLYVTVEQSAQELASKCVSRYMAQLGTPYQCSGSELTNANARRLWGDENRESVALACELFAAETGDRLRIIETRERPTVAEIRTKASLYASAQGRPPVLFIDYLQLLAPPRTAKGNLSDKQATDLNVMLLRQLARDLGITVFLISSLNRSSYLQSIDLSSFKESGAIEYGADVLLGLQPSGVLSLTMDEHKSREQVEAGAQSLYRQYKDARKATCELLVLKHRCGAVPSRPLRMEFDKPASNFTEL